MTEGQIVALLWGPFAVLFGTCFIVFRNQISTAARAQRARRGIELSPEAQSPLVQCVGGVVLVIAGIAVFIGGLTGALY